jgi:hypothetical protein
MTTATATTATQDEWHYYREALQGRFGPVREDTPQSGYYRHYDKGDPVAIWREDGALIMMLGEAEITDRIERGRIWLDSCKQPVTFDRYNIRVASGMWPGLPEKLKAKPAAPPAAPAETPAATPQTAPAAATSAGSAPPAPGHNSGEPEAFRVMKAEIEADVANATARFAASPVVDKESADLAHDWGSRIVQAARRADAARLAETEPLRKQVDEINARWNAVAETARKAGASLQAAANAWGLAEAERQRKIAAEKARAEWEAEQARRKAEREAEAAARAAAAAEVGEAPPPPEPEIAPMPAPAPVIPETKVVLGTGLGGKRATAKSKAAETATIVDLKAAAAYFAGQQHPDLVACIQKLADKAAKARAEVPGVRFSWQGQKETI